MRVYHAGQPAQAARLLEPLLSEYGEAERETARYADLCTGLGSALAESGRLKPARQLFETAGAVRRKLGDDRGAAEVEFNLGNVSRYANHRQGAVDHFRAALDLARKVATPDGETLVGTCLLSLANLFLSLGVVDEARPWLHEFEALPDAVRHQPELRWSHLFQQAKLHEIAGERAAARQTLEEALAIAQRMGNESCVHETRVALASIDGAAPGSLDALAAAHDHVREQDSPERLTTTFELAKALAAAGRGDEARARFDECLEIAALRRSRLDQAQRYHVMEQVVPIVRHLVTSLLAQGDPARAFEVSEHAQGRAILDLMFRHQTRRQGGRDIRSDGAGRLILSSLSLAEVTEGLAASGAHLLKFFRLGEHALQGWFVGPAGILACWDARAALPALEAVLGALSGMLSDAPPAADSVAGRAPGTPHAPVRARVRSEPRRSRDGWPELQAELAALALALLPAAVRRHLATGRGRLVVVPHDVLFHLPFGAMPVDDCLLGDRWEVALAPSAGCWLQLDPRRDADPDSLPRVAADQRQIPAVVVAVRVSEQVDVEIIPGVADSVEGLAFDPLEGTLPEAKAVLAAIGGVGLLGPQALKPALQPLLRHARILHLATHGYWHVLGENSFLVLAGDSQPAGANALFARDVLEEPMQAELVVLSACQTGLGAPHPDSYLGLPQAFNIAGARAVLASLWPVDDEATRRLMAAFYGELARGATPAVALQVAQRALRAQSDTASGACWAAFQFLGWPFRPMETAASTGQPGDAAAKFAGPEFCGGDFLWTDGQPGQALPLTALEPFRLKWDEAVLLAGHTLKVLRKY